MEKATLGAILVDLVRPEDLRPMYGVECLGSGGFTLEVPVEVEAAIPVAFIDLGGDGPTSDDVQGQGAEIAASKDVEGVVVTLAADAPISGLMPNRPVLRRRHLAGAATGQHGRVAARGHRTAPDSQPPPGVEPVVEGGPDGFDGDECDCPPFEGEPFDGGPGGGGPGGTPDPNQPAAVDGPFAALIPPGSPLRWLIPVSASSRCCSVWVLAPRPRSPGPGLQGARVGLRWGAGGPDAAARAGAATGLVGPRGRRWRLGHRRRGSLPRGWLSYCWCPARGTRGPAGGGGGARA